MINQSELNEIVESLLATNAKIKTWDRYTYTLIEFLFSDDSLVRYYADKKTGEEFITIVMLNSADWRTTLTVSESRR